MARILVIEDDGDLRDIVAYNLAQAGHELRAAAAGRDGLRTMADWRAELVVLDLMLPDMPGTDVCRALRADRRTGDVLIMMLTARSTEIDRVVGFELGADDYLTKPF